MTLKDNLYTITHSERLGDAARYELCLQADCVIYKAHFPGQPITPGVCIVQTAKEILEDMTGLQLHITAIKNVKFLAVISPRDTLHIIYNISKVSIDEASKTVKAQVLVSDASEAKAKISFTCSYGEIL